MKFKRLLAGMLAASVAVVSITAASLSAETGSGNDPLKVNFPGYEGETLVLELPEKQLFPDYYPMSEIMTLADDTVNWDAVGEKLIGKLASCPKGEVDISDLDIPFSQEYAYKLSDFVYYEVPELFHVKNLGTVSGVGNEITTLKGVTYIGEADESGEYSELMSQCKATADKLLDGIKDNTALTEEQKALLVHDRLAVLCEYNLDAIADGADQDYFKHTHNMTGALTVRYHYKPVCQGYAMAYIYLLKQIGMDADYCSSTTAKHAWNIVYIDNKAYHVDVTHDDPTADLIGRVYHKFFLLSTDKILTDSGHVGIDYPSPLPATDIGYDNGDFWTAAGTEFQLDPNDSSKMYYIRDDSVKTENGSTIEAQIVMYDASTDKSTDLFKIENKWYASKTGQFWVGNYSKLAQYNGTLYYSTPDSICSFDPATKTSKTVYTETDLVVNDTTYESIYGFTCRDGKFILEIAPSIISGNSISLDIANSKTKGIDIPIPISGIELDKTTAEVPVEGEITLTATVLPENTTEEKTVTWSSSDDSIATVSDGTVTGVAEGTVIITASVTGASGEFTADCEVTVTPKAIPATEIKLDKDTLSLVEGEIGQLTATILPENNTDNLTVVWSTSDDKIATVDETGKVTAVAVGTATITAKAGEFYAACEVTVTEKQIPATGIELSKTDLSLEEGKSEQLTATIKPENNTDNLTVEWSSDNGAAATVDEKGNVTAVKAGTATITATAGKFAATCEVTVTAKPVEEVHATGVSLDKKTISLEVGDIEQLTATPIPADSADVRIITWSSSDPDVVSIANVGGVATLTATGAGTATVNAHLHTNGGASFEAACEVTVKPKPIPATGIKIDRTSVSMTENTAIQLTATVLPENNTDNLTVVWSTSDEKIAAVDEKGNVTAVKPGTATITAKAGEFTATCKVTVTAKPAEEIHATEIKLDKDTLSLVEGENGQLTATILPENNTDNLTVVWSSDNEAAATVDQSGKVTAVKAGTATITAKAGEFTATCKVTVTAKPAEEIHATEIKLDKDTLSLVEGENGQLTATILPENNTDNLTVVWSSDNEAAATVDQSGKVTAVKPGTANITAKAGQFTATCKVTVTAKPAEEIPATGIEINKTALSLEEGKSEQLTATVSPENHTDEVVWLSDNESVATVDQNGNVTAVKAGKATISATAGTFTAKCEVTVTEKAPEVTTPQTSAVIPVISNPEVVTEPGAPDVTTPQPDVTTTKPDAPSPDTTKPVDGNDPLAEIIEEAKNNEIVKLSPFHTGVSAEAMEALMKTGNTMEIALGNGVTVSINGSNVTKPTDLDLNVIIGDVLNTGNGDRVTSGQRIDAKLLPSNSKTMISVLAFELKHHGEYGALVNISIPVGDAYNGKSVIIYRLTEGSLVPVANSVVSNGKVTFARENASFYAIAIEEEQAPAGDGAVSSGNSGNNNTGNGSGNGSNPSTGVTVASVAVLADVFGAVAVIARKKRK